MDMFAFLKVSGYFLSTKMNLCHQSVNNLKFLFLLFCSICSYPVVEPLSHGSSERLNKLSTNENFSTALPALSFMCFWFLVCLGYFNWGFMVPYNCFHLCFLTLPAL